METFPLEGAELVNLTLIAAASSILVEHLKPLLGTLPGFRAAEPWPLVVDAVCVVLSLWLFYAGQLPSLGNAPEAALAGLLAALTAQGGYKAVKVAPSISVEAKPQRPADEPLENLLEQP